MIRQTHIYISFTDSKQRTCVLFVEFFRRTHLMLSYVFHFLTGLTNSKDCKSSGTTVSEHLFGFSMFLVAVVS